MRRSVFLAQLLLGHAGKTGCRPLPGRLFECHGHRNRCPDHRVVAHADETHHLHMGGNGGRSGELGIRVHAAHGVGHAIGGRSCPHIVRMEGAAGAAAGGYRKVFLALLQTLLFIGAGDRMLETGRVGGVAGDRDIDAFQVVDGNALTDVVGTKAADFAAFAVRICRLLDNAQFTGRIVEAGLHIGEPVDPGDDLGCIFTKTVEDNP